MRLLFRWSMEFPHDGLNPKTHQLLQGLSEGRPSYQRRKRNRLQKRRPGPKMRAQSREQAFSSGRESFTTMRNSGSAVSAFEADAGKPSRRSSIRNAVRRLFGRKRQTIAVSPPPSTLRLSAMPRHVYHKSEPVGLPPHLEVPEPAQSRSSIQLLYPEPHRDGSKSPGIQRSGSPYAVQFPKSAMLKPMDLGNSFLPAPSHPIRRRQTLPTVRLTEENAEDVEHAGETTMAADAQNEASDEDTKVADFEGVGQAPMKFPRTMSSRRKIKRKSRSIDDITTAGQAETLPPGRSRDEEIYRWRQSFQQPAVLRASGFTTSNVTRRDPIDKVTTDAPLHVSADETGCKKPTQDQGEFRMPETSSPVASTTIPARRPSQRSAGSHYITADELDQDSPVTCPATSTDLETRIANLEADLSTFQLSLQRLTGERNRRTIVVGTKPPADRSSGEVRTPSMLADTLADPMESCNFEYGCMPALRSSGSPKSSSTRHRRSKTNPGSEIKYSERPLPMLTSPRFPTPPRSHPSPSLSHIHSSPISSHSPSEPQPHTFRSLYQMLSFERSARHKLENHVQDLQAQVVNLHARLTTHDSTKHTKACVCHDHFNNNRRSSYLLTGSSARLQQLLQETETCPASPSSSSAAPSRKASSPSLQQSSGVMSPALPLLSSPVAEVVPVTSRFSRSESELGAAADLFERERDGEDREEVATGTDEETPYEDYCTPREERNEFGFGERGGGIDGRVRVGVGGEMF